MIRIPIIQCGSGLYLRWWYNGYHYYCFQNYHEITLNSENTDIVVSNAFSRISKVEQPTKIKAGYTYQVNQEGISLGDIPGFKGLLLAESVYQYESGAWHEVESVFDDWYLPSRDELNQMRSQLYLYGVGGFTNGSYWSSTEVSSTQALPQDFSNGNQTNTNKGSSLNVRACRSFTAAVGAYVKRDTGPGGGLIFYVSGTLYLEAAPSDQSAGAAWSDITNVFCYATLIGYGQGQTNTNTILAQSATAPAAKLCNDLSVISSVKESGAWYEVDIKRGEFLIKDNQTPAYEMNFEIRRKDLPNTSTTNIYSIKLYIGDTLCDIDDDETVPLNKQVNDIAEMQDRQSDYTQQFRIRRTRAMRLLFERSGETGSNSEFPYQNRESKHIVSGVEVITAGNLILDKKDDEYYYVSIYSGNLNFFKAIEGKTLNDLTLAGTAHTWTRSQQASKCVVPTDFTYPLCVTNDDGGITDDGSIHSIYGGWLWPFVKVKSIWDEIFSNAGYTDSGDILTNTVFERLYMPIASLAIAKNYTDRYLYALYNSVNSAMNLTRNKLVATLGGFLAPTVLLGDDQFRWNHIYITKFIATYKFRVTLNTYPVVAGVYLYVGGVETASFTLNTELSVGAKSVWDLDYAGVANESITFYINTCQLYYYKIQCIEIKDAQIGYGSVIDTLATYLPSLSQTDFIKMICNMFGLIPETTPRDRKIKFWNLLDLYDNIPNARDWSGYLSEQDEETEFKFGDYAQNNYLKYKESDDVATGQGDGNMIIEDSTLPNKKDLVLLPVSTCDEFTVLTDLNVSRIAFNKYDAQAVPVYTAEKEIDPRIVYCHAHLDGGKFRIYDGFTGTAPSGSYSVVTGGGYIATSMEVALSSLIENYSGLSRLLTKTTLRRLKFNLPVFEVSNLNHDIPIYLSQYNSYFYVNKIKNYIHGKICTNDLIKL